MLIPARAISKAALAMSGLAPSSAFSPLIWGCYTATLRHSFTLRGESISLGRLLVLCLTHISCAHARALFRPIFPSLRTPTATPPLTYEIMQHGQQYAQRALFAHTYIDVRYAHTHTTYTLTLSNSVRLSKSPCALPTYLFLAFSLACARARARACSPSPYL